MRSLALPILTLLLATGGILTGQTDAAPNPDKSRMHQHYDAAYRFQSAGDFARADLEHKHFLVAAFDHLANFYANVGDYLHAAPTYDEALELIPTNFELLMDYAGASLDAHDPIKARTLLQTVLGLESANVTKLEKADVHLLFGRALRALGDTKAAMQEFQAAIAMEPSIDNYDALADAELELYGNRGAAPIFTEMRARFGDSAAVHMRIGRTYALSGFPDLAIEEFKEAVARDYKMPDVHYSLGAAYMSDLATELPLAEAEFRKELALHPDDKFSYPQLGYIALRHLNYREAEFDFRHAVVADPVNAEIFSDLGKLYVDTRRPLEAEAAFRKAIALTIDPSLHDYAIERVHYQLGRLLLVDGNESEGQHELQVAEQLLSERDLQADQKLTGQLVHRSPLEKTRVATPKEVEELKLFVKQVGPLIAGSYNNLGVHAAVGEKYGEAATYFRLAEKWDPKLPGVDRNWGRAAFAAHDCAQALEPLRRAVADDFLDTDLAAMLNHCQSLLPVMP
jgi:tetratricopeptide (TPR) repeat protein